MRRREVLAALLAGCGTGTGFAPAAAAAAVAYPPVIRGRRLAFPRDHGAHLQFRTEWWYATAWIDAPGGPFGTQITFFRTRTRHAPRNPSAFAPHQLLFAHAALVSRTEGIRHAQRAARSGFGLAQASERDTDLRIGTWSMQRGPDDHYQTSIADADFALALRFAPPAAPVAQGDRGFSRKGPAPEQASYYYSRPQLRVDGKIRSGRQGRTIPVEGVGWLDHEWSSEILDPQAQGWDWVGLNFDDGSALMAFRIRDSQARTLYATARWIRGGETRDTTPRFDPRRTWRSPRTGVSYPVAMSVRLDERDLELQPLIEDQELDTRVSTGTLYWEGAVRVFESGKAVGRGYLELTGYGQRLRM